MPTPNSTNGQLRAPERNRFFYGKLMDVAQFEKEQCYFTDKHSLINRLVFGHGVICGLRVDVDLDDGKKLTVQPGVAIDGLGREIVLPNAVSVDPYQPTDDQGEPDGDRLTDDGTVEVCLVYAESESDPVPVLVPDCEASGNCAPCTIREESRVLIRMVSVDVPEPPGCVLGNFPVPANPDLHRLLSEHLSSSCPQPVEDACVTLARVTLDAAGGDLLPGSIDLSAGRSLVYGNRHLYRLILCLAERVEQLTAAPILRYVSGDGQEGEPELQLDALLIVEVVDAQGRGLKDVPVQFQIVSGGGTVSPMTTKTDDDGLAKTKWKLGLATGEQKVVAQAVGTNHRVKFTALAVESA